mmetsp:Transcript_19393/g.46542  ORF Transcript_19393/g.46542 Transcript_19393/m.46542 type:complete len:84 (+) Transcript_19393:605-856(+)
MKSWRTGALVSLQNGHQLANLTLRNVSLKSDPGRNNSVVSCAAVHEMHATYGIDNNSVHELTLDVSNSNCRFVETFFLDEASK